MPVITVINQGARGCNRLPCRQMRERPGGLLGDGHPDGLDDPHAAVPGLAAAAERVVPGRPTVISFHASGPSLVSTMTESVLPAVVRADSVDLADHLGDR